MHLAPPPPVASASCGSAVVDSLLIVATIVCGVCFVFGPCVVVKCLMSFLVLQSSHCGRRESGGGWLLRFGCLPAVM